MTDHTSSTHKSQHGQELEDTFSWEQDLQSVWLRCGEPVAATTTSKTHMLYTGESSARYWGFHGKRSRCAKLLIIFLFLLIYFDIACVLCSGGPTLFSVQLMLHHVLCLFTALEIQ